MRVSRYFVTLDGWRPSCELMTGTATSIPSARTGVPAIPFHCRNCGIKVLRGGGSWLKVEDEVCLKCRRKYREAAKVAP